MSAAASASPLTCSGCGTRMRPWLLARDYNRNVPAEAPFRYDRCDACGLASLRNVPDDLGRYYVQEYHGIPATSEAVERGAAHDHYKIDIVLEHRQGGRLLEIGPAWGAFSLLAKRAGFEVEAIEMSAPCCEFLASTIGVKPINTFDEVDGLAQATPPDVIALWHVFEHVRNPWRLLEAAAARLRPGGILVIATPNPASFQLRVFGRFWAHLDAPRHVHLVPAALLRQRAEAFGLRQVSLTTRDTGSIGWDDFGWRFSLANLAPVAGLRRAFRFAGRFLTPLARIVERREGAGSAYTVVFEKPKR